MNERELTNRLKDQDVEALEYLIEKYSKLILGVTASVLTQSHEREYIDDVYNDVIMTLWFKIESFQMERGKFKNWIISIAKFKALDYKKKMKKRLNEQDIEEIIVKEKETVEGQILRQEKKEGLIEVVNQLEPVSREIFLLRYMEDRSVEDIATQLGLSTSAVYTRLSRGRKKLKKLMGGYHE